MKKILIENYSDIATIMFDMIGEGEINDICFVGFFDDVIRILEELIIGASIKDMYVWDKEKEYILILDKEYNLWLEPLYSKEEKTYKNINIDYILVADDCDSKLFDKLKNKRFVYEVGFEDEEETNEEPTCKENYYIEAFLDFLEAYML